MKKDIQSQEDIFTLVSAFYARVRTNKEIGPFFNEHIEDWPAHLEKLSNFWETNLFFVNKFKGSPMEAHVRIDQKSNNSIEQKHFGEWLNMWFATIDELFEGERANIAKNRARNMSTHLFMNIYENR